jgi:hypothetical protein
MPSSELDRAGADPHAQRPCRTRRGRRALLVTLLAANAALSLVWFWLPSDRLGVSPGAFVLSSASSHAWLLDAVRREGRILFLGTSESDTAYNLGYQLNHLTPDDPQLVVVARAGTSPIHTSMAFARSKKHGMTPPPLVLVVNLVYFTRSHDVINDGWLGNVLPSPAFYLMDHEGIRGQLSPAVRDAYDRHFALRRLLLPFTAQEYFGNLLFLRARAPLAPSTLAPYALARERPFSRALPRYDEARGVWASYHASDEAVPSRWEVSRAEESLNLKGLASTLAVLREQEAPVLVLILPTNRAFYRYHGLDMAEYERRYRVIRDRIRALAAADHIFVLDLYDEPRLHLGFLDRMHPDEYGYFQLARHLIATEPYQAFIDGVRRYYDRAAPTVRAEQSTTSGTPSASPGARPPTLTR